MLAKIEDFSLTLQSKLQINRIRYTMYKGSSWFSITHAAAASIVSIKNAILKRFRFGANTDEIWLQTYLMESPFAKQIAPSNMRYIKWVQGNPSPEILTLDDYDALCSSEMLFARKFNWDRDHLVIMKLKEFISED